MEKGGKKEPSPGVGVRKVLKELKSELLTRESGRGCAIVFEQPDAIKTYLVRWKGAKFDITRLAKLRWIEKRKTPDLCRILGEGRSTIRQRIRTLRKSGISELNLTPEERLLIEKQITAETEIYGDRYR